MTPVATRDATCLWTATCPQPTTLASIADLLMSDAQDAPQSVDEDAPFDAEKSLAYLRANGVEVETVEDRQAKRAAAAAKAPSDSSDCIPFCYVKLPAESTEAVSERRGQYTFGGGDALPSFLAPCFADDACLDEDVVARETAGRLKGMLIGGAEGNSLAPPTAKSLEQEAFGGKCEAWPLAQPLESNDFRAVRLYIDEIGALRARPRNARAEVLAAACGLHGVAIHGDAYVGRCARAPVGERNEDFLVSDLVHDSSWVVAARRAHQESANAMDLRDNEHLPSGGGGADSGYSWTQAEDDIEVRVTRGIPTEGGKAVKARIAVSYGKGASLSVKVDGAEVLGIKKLFDRVAPDECSWTLDKGTLVIAMEKVEPKAWADLALPGSD